MDDFPEMTNQRQQRQDGFHHHPVIPFSAMTQIEVVRMPIGLGEAIIGKDHHEIRLALHHVLKTGTGGDIGRVTRPINNQRQRVQHKTEFAPKIQQRFGKPLHPIRCGLRPSRRG